MPLVPVYLIVPTFVLVVIPSVAAILLRLALYQHLGFLQERVRRLIKKQSGGQKPRIVEELEKRFEDARESLDQVNTAALIDQVYSREKVWLFSCDQIDYFCRILPNLLLSFGLLGTFLGITINLAALSQTIVNKADSFNGVEVALKQLMETVISYTEQVNSAIESLGDRLILNISEKVTTNNQHIQTIITIYERHTNQLNIIIDTLKLDFMELLRDNNVRLTGEYKNVGDRLFTGIKHEAEISIKNSRLLAGKIQECSKQLAEIKQEIYQLGKAQPHNDLKNHATVDDLADFTDLFSN